MLFRRLSLFAIASFVAIALPFAAARADDPVVARVDGVEIRQSELALAEADIGSSLPPGASEQRRDALISYLVDVTALSRAAESKKLDQVPGFSQKLAFARKKVLVEAMLEQQSKTAVSDADVKKFYDETLKPAEEAHVYHILVDSEDQAKEILAKLKGGADFAQVATEMSKDKNTKGGDLGFITKEQVVPEFGEAAFKLEKGKISDPVKSQFGWHIIKVDDKRVRQPPPYDAVKDRIKEMMVQKANGDFITKVRESAKVERMDKAPPATPATPPAAEKKK